MRFASLFIGACLFAACSSDTSSDPTTSAADTSVSEDATKADDPDATTPTDDDSANDTGTTSPGDTTTDPDATCDDECPSVGARECDGDGSYRVCQAGGNGCRAWSASALCAGDTVCDGGQCVCQDECPTADDSCESDNLVTRCGDFDDDDCLELETAPCTSDTACEGGACVPTGETCVDECATAATSCDGDDVTTCGQLDVDDCLDLQTRACGDGSTCVAGACNERPQASLLCPAGVALGGVATLDASASTDDGTIVGYTFSSDVSDAEVEQSAPTFELTTTVGGPVRASVAVADDVGLSASASCDMVVYVQPDDVASLSAASGEHAVALTWPSADYASQYDIFWSTSDNVSESSAKITIDADDGPEQRYLHDGLTIGQAYYYRVRAKNPFYSSSLSASASAIARPAFDLRVIVISMLGANVCDFSHTCIGYEHSLQYALVNVGAAPLSDCFQIQVDHDVTTAAVDDVSQHCISLAPGAQETTTIVVEGDPLIEHGADASVTILDANDGDASNDSEVHHWTRPSTCTCE